MMDSDENYNVLLGSTDLIQKFISSGKHLSAIKFSYEFELTDKFQPVPLLKAYVKESKKAAKEIRKEGKNSRKSLVISHFL